jgi:hypothetical protein
VSRLHGAGKTRACLAELVRQLLKTPHKTGGRPMSEHNEQQVYVKVKDVAGNEFVCPIEALKNLKEVSEEVLDNCVDDATVGRYSGNIKVIK